MTNHSGSVEELNEFVSVNWFGTAPAACESGKGESDADLYDQVKLFDLIRRVQEDHSGGLTTMPLLVKARAAFLAKRCVRSSCNRASEISSKFLAESVVPVLSELYGKTCTVDDVADVENVMTGAHLAPLASWESPCTYLELCLRLIYCGRMDAADSLLTLAEEKLGYKVSITGVEGRISANQLEARPMLVCRVSSLKGPEGTQTEEKAKSDDEIPSSVLVESGPTLTFPPLSNPLSVFLIRDNDTTSTYSTGSDPSKSSHSEAHFISRMPTGSNDTYTILSLCKLLVLKAYSLYARSVDKDDEIALLCTTVLNLLTPLFSANSSEREFKTRDQGSLTPNPFPVLEESRTESMDSSLLVSALVIVLSACFFRALSCMSRERLVSSCITLDSLTALLFDREGKPSIASATGLAQRDQRDQNDQRNESEKNTCGSESSYGSEDSRHLRGVDSLAVTPLERHLGYLKNLLDTNRSAIVSVSHEILVPSFWELHFLTARHMCRLGLYATAVHVLRRANMDHEALRLLVSIRRAGEAKALAADLIDSTWSKYAKEKGESVNDRTVQPDTSVEGRLLHSLARVYSIWAALDSPHMYLLSFVLHRVARMIEETESLTPSPCGSSQVSSSQYSHSELFGLFNCIADVVPEESPVSRFQALVSRVSENIAHDILPRFESSGRIVSDSCRAALVYFKSVIFGFEGHGREVHFPTELEFSSWCLNVLSQAEKTNSDMSLLFATKGRLYLQEGNLLAAGQSFKRAATELEARGEASGVNSAENTQKKSVASYWRAASECYLSLIGKGTQVSDSNWQLFLRETALCAQKALKLASSVSEADSVQLTRNALTANLFAGDWWGAISAFRTLHVQLRQPVFPPHLCALRDGVQQACAAMIVEDERRVPLIKTKFCELLSDTLSRVCEARNSIFHSDLIHMMISCLMELDLGYADLALETLVRVIARSEDLSMVDPAELERMNELITALWDFHNQENTATSDRGATLDHAQNHLGKGLKISASTVASVKARLSNAVLSSRGA